MLGQLCDRDCKFQNYHYLSENDTICLFFYRKIDCYKETRFKEDKIDEYYENKWEDAIISN